MVSQYDQIAEQYRLSKQSPLRRWVEVPTFLELVGDVDGLRVLDLACGDGFYSRKLAEMGARVVGVDISAEMIRLAREAQAHDSLSIDYHCADVAALPALGRFDLVTAAYLLHYAKDQAELGRMCGNIAECLSAGGRFVGINENPAKPAEEAGEYAAYGFSKSLLDPLQEGSRINYQMLAGRELFAFEVHWFSAQVYQLALTQAGFSAVEWCPLVLDKAGIAAMGENYFAAYLSQPPVLGLACQR